MGGLTLASTWAVPRRCPRWTPSPPLEDDTADVKHKRIDAVVREQEGMAG